MRVFSSIAAILMLTSCAGQVIRDNPVRVEVPVPQPCADELPAEVPTLMEEYTNEKWCDLEDRKAGKCRGLDIKQKSQAISRKGLENRSYGEGVKVATSGCPTIKET